MFALYFVSLLMNGFSFTFSNTNAHTYIVISIIILIKIQSENETLHWHCCYDDDPMKSKPLTVIFITRHIFLLLFLLFISISKGKSAVDINTYALKMVKSERETQQKFEWKIVRKMHDSVAQTTPHLFQCRRKDSSFLRTAGVCKMSLCALCHLMRNSCTFLMNLSSFFVCEIKFFLLKLRQTFYHRFQYALPSYEMASHKFVRYRSKQ